MLAMVDSSSRMVRVPWPVRMNVPPTPEIAQLMARHLAAALCLLTLSLLNQRLAVSATEIRIGVLAFGTVTWELAALDQEKLSSKQPYLITATKLASPEAAKIALQGGSVDVIVADWIWVARQRQQGFDFTFSPYSTSHGALIVPANSSIQSVTDLKGKKLGVAGGGNDKNWLLLRALAARRYRFELQESADVSFGAPPLLNEQLSQGRLDALLNYWHYAARLEALGYRQILDGAGLLRELGVQAELPNLGYVFRESWARQHSEAWSAFLDASAAARARLCENDQSWQRIAHLSGESNAKTQALLRRGYCAGTIKRWGPVEIQAAEQVFEILRETGGEQLVGRLNRLPSGLFWSVAAH